MKQKFRKSLSRLLFKIGSNALVKSQRLRYIKPKLIQRGEPRALYRLHAGFDLWLNDSGYIDRQIIERGEFEPASTRAVQRLVKEGDTVLDVGANIGYYTALLSQLVGATGRVIAFEPTKHYGDVLQRNIEVNGFRNVQVVTQGLSNTFQDLTIDIGPSSATLHSPAGFDSVIGTELISLTTLDDYVTENEIEKIDFIKIDIDGHEPLFFEGAWNALAKYSPVVIFEVSHLHYLEAGVAAWDFYDRLRERGYRCFDENNLVEISSKEAFLRQCANFAYSSNVLISKQESL